VLEGGGRRRRALPLGSCIAISIAHSFFSHRAIFVFRFLSSVPYLFQIAEHASELHYYVEPAALRGDLPLGVSSTVEYVAKVEADDVVAAASGSSLDAGHGHDSSGHMLLTDAADKFLASGRQLLVLLGEAGSGKSTFMWQLCKRLLAASPPGFLDVPVSRMASRVKPLYLPVYVELKRYKAGSLAGLLDSALLSAGLSREAVQALRGQDTDAPLVRVVLLADGFDELQGDVLVVNDFVRTACVGWHPALLAVIVTSRESRVGDRTRERSIFGEHDRALLLPFTKDRVRVCAVVAGLCSTSMQ
jgi:hypothetical protein